MRDLQHGLEFHETNKCLPMIPAQGTEQTRLIISQLCLIEPSFHRADSFRVGYRSLSYELDPLFVEVDDLHQPAGIHPGNGFDVRALFLVSPPGTVLMRRGWQGIIQDLFDDIEGEGNFFLSDG